MQYHNLLIKTVIQTIETTMANYAFQRISIQPQKFMSEINYVKTKNRGKQKRKLSVLSPRKILKIHFNLGSLPIYIVWTNSLNL